jgi:hypothetical protein
MLSMDSEHKAAHYCFGVIDTSKHRKEVLQVKRIAMLMFLAGAICVPGLRARERSREPVTCTNQTLKGAYAVSISGTRPAPVVLPMFQGVPVGTTEQVIGAFIIVFDGEGSITLTDHVTVKGSLSGLFPVFPANPSSGTYSVNSDCTGTFTGAPPADLVNNFVIFNGGEEFRTVVVSPQQVMVSAVAKKVEKEDSRDWR